MILTTLSAMTMLSPLEAPRFDTPFRVKAGEELISVEIGHAAPVYDDLDGDGLKELIVGQFRDGKIRIYKNHGTNTAPVFKDFEWFEAGGEVVAVGGS